MRRSFPSATAAAVAIAALTVVGAFVAVPLVVRAALGLVTVFVLPGFAIERAIHPDRDFEPDEQPFVWFGVSLAVGIVAAVALAASPIGISRQSFAVAVGGFSGLLALYTGLRSMRHEVGHDG